MPHRLRDDQSRQLPKYEDPSAASLAQVSLVFCASFRPVGMRRTAVTGAGKDLREAKTTTHHHVFVLRLQGALRQIFREYVKSGGCEATLLGPCKSSATYRVPIILPLRFCSGETKRHAGASVGLLRTYMHQRPATPRRAPPASGSSSEPVLPLALGVWDATGHV